MLAFGTIFLLTIVSSHNHVLLIKYVNFVYKIITYVLNRCLFSLMFSDMIHTYEKFQKIIWLLVSLNRHKHNFA